MGVCNYTVKFAGYDAFAAKAWAAEVKWLELKVIDSPEPKADVGYVEFKAKYGEQGKAVVMHERSEFHQMNGIWYYVNGEQYGDKSNTAGKGVCRIVIEII